MFSDPLEYDTRLGRTAPLFDIQPIEYKEVNMCPLRFRVMDEVAVSDCMLGRSPLAEVVIAMMLEHCGIQYMDALAGRSGFHEKNPDPISRANEGGG
jgi:hypothetical protein